MKARAIKTQYGFDLDVADEAAFQRLLEREDDWLESTLVGALEALPGCSDVQHDGHFGYSVFVSIEEPTQAKRDAVKRVIREHLDRPALPTTEDLRRLPLGQLKDLYRRMMEEADQEVPEDLDDPTLRPVEVAEWVELDLRRPARLYPSRVGLGFIEELWRALGWVEPTADDQPQKS